MAPNQLKRAFTVQAPDRVYVGDITYLPTGEGWLYLAVVLDLCSRAVVGWSMANHMRAELVNQALSMARYQRQPAAGVDHAYGPGQPVWGGQLSAAPELARDRAQDEPQGQLLGQRRSRELLPYPKNRIDLAGRWREIRACNDNACGASKGQNCHESLLDLTFLIAATDPNAPIY